MRTKNICGSPIQPATNCKTMQPTKTHCKYAHYAYVHVTHNHIAKESYTSAKEPYLFANELFCSGKIRLFYFFLSSNRRRNFRTSFSIWYGGLSCGEYGFDCWGKIGLNCSFMLSNWRENARILACLGDVRLFSGEIEVLRTGLVYFFLSSNWHEISSTYPLDCRCRALLWRIGLLVLKKDRA